MAEALRNPVFLDATVLSNFASTDGLSYVTAVLEMPLVVPAVRDEIDRGRGAGHDYLDTAVVAIGDTVPVRDVSHDAAFHDIRGRLDAGEAESLTAAIEHDGAVATDDLAARRVANRRDVPVTGSIGLLVLGCDRGRIDVATADDWLETWRKQRGYYAPVKSVEEIL